MDRETRASELRCKPGDLARIRRAWNELLKGRLVLVRRAYSETEWLVRVLDGPAFGVSEDRRRYVVTQTLIAEDWALEPLSGEQQPKSEDAAMDSSARWARFHPEASGASN